MQSVRGEHALSGLLSHQREEIDPARIGVAGLLASDVVKAFDRSRDHRPIAESGRGGRERPGWLRQADHAGARRSGADTFVDARDPRAVAIRRTTLDDV